MRYPSFIRCTSRNHAFGFLATGKGRTGESVRRPKVENKRNIAKMSSIQLSSLPNQEYRINRRQQRNIEQLRNVSFLFYKFNIIKFFLISARMHEWTALFQIFCFICSVGAVKFTWAQANRRHNSHKAITETFKVGKLRDLCDGRVPRARRELQPLVHISAALSIGTS